ncbi:MAG: hypothetical protein WCA31_06990, partial [Acidimicrobiales bacterium]
MYAPFYLNCRSGNPPLRIGVLLDTKILPAWFERALEQIVDSNFARLELAVLNGDAQRKSTGQRRRQGLLFTLYERWDNRRIADSEDPLRGVDGSAYLENVESITVTPVTKGAVQHFPEDAIRRIREMRLDVLVRLGFKALRGEILQAARYGVWSWSGGDNGYCGSLA